MADMPRPRPPHLHHERTRHGALVWYVRVGKGPRVRIKVPYGTPGFDVAYRAALAGEEAPAAAGRPSAGTFTWLLDRYRDSQDWAKPHSVVTKRAMKASLDRRKATPFQAKNFLDAMRHLFKWALEAQHVEADPTEGLRAEKPKTEGFAVWTEAEVQRFEARWPVGTRERLALDLLLYTGLRRGDVAALGRQHVRDGVITLRTAKTGQVVSLPVLTPLAESIVATRTGDLAFIATASGRGMTKESFGNWFREACDKAGVKGSAHGLRKLGATRAADNGATEAELEALFGWRGGGMASLYTRAANRRKLALGAAEKMVPGEGSAKSYSRTSLKGAGDSAES